MVRTDKSFDMEVSQPNSAMHTMFVPLAILLRQVARFLVPIKALVIRAPASKSGAVMHSRCRA